MLIDFALDAERNHGMTAEQAASVMTIGIWLVARLAARIAASPPATIMSTGSSTSSCA